jgi:SAM-dependent methyltransferase
MPLLQVARSESPDACYVRGDMRRLPFATGAFNLVVNFFTSFGYFATDDENRQVLAEVHRVLARGGAFVLDYLNADQVRRTLVPHDTRRVGHRTVTQDRTITPDGKYVEKTIHATGFATTYLERVRLFEPGDLRCLLQEAGLVVEHEMGDYQGSALTAESPRAIFLTRRAA